MVCHNVAKVVVDLRTALCRASTRGQVHGSLTWIEREGGEEIPRLAPTPFFMELFQSCSAGSNFSMKLLKNESKIWKFKVTKAYSPIFTKV